MTRNLRENKDFCHETLDGFQWGKNWKFFEIQMRLRKYVHSMSNQYGDSKRKISQIGLLEKQDQTRQQFSKNDT